MCMTLTLKQGDLDIFGGKKAYLSQLQMFSSTIFKVYGLRNSEIWVYFLQIVTYECTTARINGAKPSTIDAWQCFLFNIRDCIKE